MDAKRIIDDAVQEGVLPQYSAWNKSFHGLRYRPDFVWHMWGKTIILEIDEQGHKYYKNESHRENSIQQAAQANCVFYRVPIFTQDDVSKLKELLY